MVIRPKNPVFFLATLVVPWHFLGTYIKIDEGEVELHRYFYRDGIFKREAIAFRTHEVRAAGFPEDLEMQPQEEECRGTYGKYSSQEIDFVLADGRIIPLNARPYTKCQIKELLQMLPGDVRKGKRLYRALGM